VGILSPGVAVLSWTFRLCPRAKRKCLYEAPHRREIKSRRPWQSPVVRSTTLAKQCSQVVRITAGLGRQLRRHKVTVEPAMEMANVEV
jgi:hypothetical protein